MQHNFTGQYQGEIVGSSGLENSIEPRVFEGAELPSIEPEKGAAITCRLATFANPIEVGKKSGVVAILRFSESAELSGDSLSCGVRFSAWGCGLDLETRAIISSKDSEPVVLEFVPKTPGELTVEAEFSQNGNLLGRRRETLIVNPKENS